MTETNYCEIDYHTIKDGKDIYLCDGHDMAFHDAEGLEPMLCKKCNNHIQAIWINTDKMTTESFYLCRNCDNEQIDKLHKKYERFNYNE
jgi:hypothetical protein